MTQQQITLTLQLSSEIFAYGTIDGRTHAVGYMDKIPPSLQSAFVGAQHFTDWSSVYSIRDETAGGSNK